jgi:transcription antitermination factor NusG
MKKWFVLYTKPHQELKVVQQLKEIGISSYCPTVKLIKQYSDRKKMVLKPLISSYVMVFIEEHKRNDVFSIFGIVRYLFWLGKPAVIPEKEITLMKNHLNGIYSTISLTNLTKGQLFKISEGPLAGKSGRVIEAQKNKIKLQLESLGMIVTLKREAA